ncbi:hypothetical protein QBC41DRAFT_325796 [Cercophora samala]|uniref:Uncharacterized protein n=1 Tax=Cercophora samala TaxID=330535 RepID=A0AA39Z8W3_9PEZI|nr:hypothetical protein QBC41DRAFT_325796 [Cercophora samala]
MKLLLSITGFAAFSIATPTRNSLMTVLGFYQSPQCNQTDPYWTATTRYGTYLAILDETDGCQNVPDVWEDVRVIKVERREYNCKVTAYTSPDCDPASGTGVAIPEDTCDPSEPGQTWKSYAIRGCVD